MTAYNRLNGLHLSENPFILDQVLRKEWGWRGLVMSDWFGTYSAEGSVRAGLDVEMPVCRCLFCSVHGNLEAYAVDYCIGPGGCSWIHAPPRFDGSESLRT